MSEAQKVNECKPCFNCRQDMEFSKDRIDKLSAENAALSERLREAEGVIEFYADRAHWKTVTVENSNQRFCIMQGSDLEYFQEPNRDSYCGKRARAYLSKTPKKDNT